MECLCIWCQQLPSRSFSEHNNANHLRVCKLNLIRLNLKWNTVDRSIDSQNVVIMSDVEQNQRILFTRFRLNFRSALNLGSKMASRERHTRTILHKHTFSHQGKFTAVWRAGRVWLRAVRPAGSAVVVVVVGQRPKPKPKPSPSRRRRRPGSDSCSRSQDTPGGC